MCIQILIMNEKIIGRPRTINYDDIMRLQILESTRDALSSRKRTIINKVGNEAKEPYDQLLERLLTQYENMLKKSGLNT